MQTKILSGMQKKTILTTFNLAIKVQTAQNGILYFQKVELMAILTICVAYFCCLHILHHMNFKKDTLFACPRYNVNK